MTVIVDASVALKWVIMEPGSDAARRVLETETLAAPDLLFIECANVLRMKCRRGLVAAAETIAALGAIEATPIRSIATRSLAASALLIAADLDATAYDSLYLAAAVAERAVLVTADEAFFRAAAGHAMLGPHVQLLGA